jgi:nitrogen fixation NifU-like protein|tara:strand:+ start:82 stop:501 length:420 start_codon:yes stop_codon:yes gene_type:complete
MDELYQKKLLRLAANATGEGEIERPDAEETLDNPTCGDRITVQITVKDGVISELKHRNRSCMLCQAAASLIGENAVGKSFSDILDIRSEMAAQLLGEEVTPPENWLDFAHFRVVASHGSRHNCVLLPFDTLIKALEKLH